MIFRRVHKIAKETISFDMSVRLSAWNNSLAPPGGTSRNLSIFKNLLRKSKFRYNVTLIKGTSHEYVCTFMIGSG